ncbi:hypothetical protein LEP1GSC086_0079 [Leptospira weilii str. LNT 1234]|nr:hypothetical protein LEP1GSC086_0079 [Leptospira weilii str. LNT 1234]
MEFLELIVFIEYKNINVFYFLNIFNVIPRNLFFCGKLNFVNLFLKCGNCNKSRFYVQILKVGTPTLKFEDPKSFL